MRKLLSMAVLMVSVLGLWSCNGEDAQATSPHDNGWNASFRVEAGSLTDAQLGQAGWVSAVATRNGTEIARAETTFTEHSVNLHIPTSGDVQLTLTGHKTKTDRTVVWSGTGTLANGNATPGKNLVALAAGPGMVPESQDSTLSSLSIPGAVLSPGFEKGTLSYTTDSIGSSESTVTISASASAKGAATVTYNGASSNVIALTGLSTSVLIRVSNGSGHLDYHVSVLRKSTVQVTPASHDSTLSSLSISGAVLSPVFDKGVLSYTTDSLNSTVASVTISAVASAGGVATITYNSSSSNQVALRSGANPVSILVKNGTSTLSYNVQILRKAIPGLDSTWNQKIDYGTLTDPRDGQLYKTVKIGTQVWMAQNLNFRKAQGSTDSVGECHSNSVDSCKKFGRLYNGNEVNYSSIALCPTGWHVSSDDDWTVLEQFLGFVGATSDTSWRGTTGGTKLKSMSGWSSGNGTDDYGFRALPAGNSGAKYASFSFTGTFATFWTSTPFNNTYIWRRSFDFTHAKVYRGLYPQNYYYSIRCLKD